MAHDIDLTTGEAAVFTTATPAWHKLGVTVSTAQTSEEAIRLARLNWTVEPTWRSRQARLRSAMCLCRRAARTATRFLPTKHPTSR